MDPKYTRVTDVLFPFSGLKAIDPTILSRAAERGTIVHNAIDAAIAGLGMPSIPDTCKGYIESFKQWAHDKEFAEKPPRFYCDDLFITGECDALYYTEQGLALVDFKTPASEGKTWNLQGSAYSYLAKKAGHNIVSIEFVQLMKNGKMPSIYIYPEDFDLFKECLKIYKIFFKDAKEENYIDYL